MEAAEYFSVSEEAPGAYRLLGELDAHTAPILAEGLGTAVARGLSITLDCSGLSFVDSSGIREILRAARRMNGQRPIVVLDPSYEVARVFDLLGVDALADLVVVRRAAR